MSDQSEDTKEKKKKPEQSKNQSLLLPAMKEKLSAVTKFLRLFDDLPENVKKPFLDTLDTEVLPQLRKQVISAKADDGDGSPVRHADYEK